MRVMRVWLRAWGRFSNHPGDGSPYPPVFSPFSPLLGLCSLAIGHPTMLLTSAAPQTPHCQLKFDQAPIKTLTKLSSKKLEVKEILESQLHTSAQVVPIAQLCLLIDLSLKLLHSLEATLPFKFASPRKGVDRVQRTPNLTSCVDL